MMLGVTTCGELRGAAARVLRAFEGRKTRDFLLRISLGLSGEEVNEEEGAEIGEVGRKSLSSERTFSAKTSPEDLRSQLRELCLSVAEEMASSVPPLAAKGLGLKMKTSAFEVKNKQVMSQRFVGFSSGSSACVPPGKPGNGAHGEAPAEESPASNAPSGEVVRVAGELFDALVPHLEEQMPCSLRLMGVRVSHFRSARMVLDRGQQQLGRFFQGPAVEKRQKELPADETAETLVPKPLLSAADAGFVVDIVDSSEGEGNDGVVDIIDCGEQDSREIGADVDSVICPICGLRVPVPEADCHVNAHYDTPAKAPRQAPPQATASLPGRKRKAQQAEIGIGELLRRRA